MLRTWLKLQPKKQKPLGPSTIYSNSLASSMALALCYLAACSVSAQVNVSVSANDVQAIMPDIGIGLHTSVYANNFGNAFVPGSIADGGIQLLRYPGGNYASIYHWSNHTAIPDGYAASQSHFGNFVENLLIGSGSKGMVTVNYGGSLQDSMGGQAKEAAAWVAYANADASIYNTPQDITIGIDAEGNDWKTAGYWANLRSSTPGQNPDNQYDFLAINHDAPIGIEYWEIGNEINGNGYYSDQSIYWNWQHDLNASYDNPVDTNPNDPNEPLYYPDRANNPALSPTAYGQNFQTFYNEMKAIDPSIKIGGVLVGPNGVGDMPSNLSRDWDRNVLQQAGSLMDFGIIHLYPCGGGNNTNCVLNATDDFPGVFDEVRDRIETYVGPGASDDIELHLTEFGYFGEVSDPEINGVYAANTYATMLAEGIKSVHWLELSKDHYLGDGAPNPGGAYHGIQVFSNIAETGAEFVDTTSSSGSVEVQSTVLPDGSVGVLIANLRSSGNTDVNINISDIDLDVSGTTWLYGVNQSTPLETSLASGLGNTFTVNVPYRSILAVRIDAATGLLGDYNGNGTVDAADYAVWLSALGGNTLLNDPTPGTVDQSDYDYWKSNFGATSTSGSTAPIPEPSAMLIALLAIVSVGLSRHIRQTL